MKKIYEYLLHETNFDIDKAKLDEVVIAVTSDDRFTITRFENGLIVIKVKKKQLPLINQYISTYQNDLFSNEAISFIDKHFRLNSTANPLEYIYFIKDLNKPHKRSVTTIPVQIEPKTLKEMNPNKFNKYPFRNPNENLIYFGTYDNGEVVSLVSGYLNDFKAIELTGETLPEYRNKGYAKSTTFAITSYLLKHGYEVFTSNGINNKASIQTVESLGFIKCACRLVFFAL